MNPPSLTWDTLDWSVLDRLRDTFLAAKPAAANYWTSRSDLENYNFTFAQRIGWKWDAVLRELQLRGWTPPPGALLDWGCGSGIAGRRVIDVFGSERFRSLRVFDHSPLAVEFAVAKARERFPSMSVGAADTAWSLETGARDVAIPPRQAGAQRDALRVPETRSNAPRSDDTPVGTLVISHVLNELDASGGRALRSVLDHADAVLWVEPGTHADSRALIALHEQLREKFLLVAPCTHQAACGLLRPANERHWCHHFARPPAGIMADSNWVRFAQRAGIDLRSLPYSFLVLERKGLRAPVPGLPSKGFSRIIGEPRFYKGFAKIFSCQEDGVRDLILQKRDAPELFKAMRSGDADPVWHWDMARPDLIATATPLGARSAS